MLLRGFGDGGLVGVVAAQGWAVGYLLKLAFMFGLFLK